MPRMILRAASVTSVLDDAGHVPDGMVCCLCPVGFACSVMRERLHRIFCTVLGLRRILVGSMPRPGTECRVDSVTSDSDARETRGHPRTHLGASVASVSDAWGNLSPRGPP